MRRIYFDNAATTPLLPEVADHMSQLLKEEFGNPSSIHFFGRKARTIIEDSRKKIASHLGASIAEIFFTSCATESNNLCLKNSVRHLGIKRIISSPVEHHCVTHTLASIKDEVEVVMMQVDELGRISLSELEDLLKGSKDETLVSLMYANNEIGNLNPIEKISSLCKEHKALFHCDAVQAVGKFPIDVSKVRFSFLSGTAHKFHGPKGVSFVYINGDNNIPPMIHGGAQERNMRSGTENVYGIAGMSLALDKAVEEMQQRKTKILKIRNILKDGLLKIDPKIRFNGVQDDDNFLYTVLSVSFPKGPKSELLHFNMDIAGICISSGSACSSGVENDSDVLTAIGHDPNRKTIRFSFSHFNSEDEVDYVLTKIHSFYS